jgi:hypothetical protein
MIKHTILIFIFFIVFSISSFADELEDYMKQKLDSIEAIIDKDPSLTEDQKAMMRMSVIFGNQKLPNKAVDSNSISDSNKSIIQGFDANFNNQIDLNNLAIDSGFMDAGMNIFTTPDKEFAPLQSKINVIDTVIKKFSCSGGTAMRDGKTQQQSDSTPIFIYWAFGLPRKGVYTSCKGGAKVEVDYFDRTIIPLENESDFVISKISDSTIKYTYNKKTTLLIMDVLTGKNVFEKNIEPTKIRKKVSGVDEGNFVGEVAEMGSTLSNVGENEVIATNIRNVPSGLYFVAILDNESNVIFIKTYNKEK